MEKFVQTEDIDILENMRSKINPLLLEEMMANIRENGLINPILLWRAVSKHSEKKYILGCGHTRFEALKKLGRNSLEIGKDCKIEEREFNFTDYIVTNLAENIHHQGSNVLEIGRAINRLRELGLSFGEISVRLSQPKSKIEKLSKLFNTLPSEIMQGIGIVVGNSNKKGFLPVTTATRISQMGIRQEQKEELYKIAKREELTTRELHLIERLLSRGINLEDALKQLKNYSTLSMTFVVREKDKQKYGRNGIKSLILNVFQGKEKPVKDLLF